MKKINIEVLLQIVLGVLILIWLVCFALEQEKLFKANVDTSLKACPFCGGQASIYYDENKSSVNGTIECDKCEAKFFVHFKDSKEDVYNELSKLWNTRVGD